MTIKGFYILMISLTLITGARSQENIDVNTLDSLIEIALERNSDILAGRLLHESAESRVGSAGTVADPWFSVGFLNLPQSSFRLDETPMSGISIGISQTIPWPGKLKARKAVARLQSDMIEQDVLSRENGVVRLVKHYYYDYSYWVLAGQILDTNLRLAQSLIDISETSYAAGIGSAQDVLRARTTLGRLENKKLYFSQMRQTSKIQLGQLIDDSTFILKDPDPYLPLEINPVPNDTANQNPFVTGYEIQSQIEHKKYSLARADYWPDVTLGVDYRIRENMPMDAVHGEDFLSAKIALKIPLWFFSRQKNDTRAARLSVRVAEEKYNSVRLQIAQQVSATKLALETIEESAARYNVSILPQAEAAFEAARIAYEVGDVDFNALLSAQTDLLDVELERLGLIKQYWQKRAELNELTGNKNYR